MRLGTVTLERYGPFEKLDLPFDPTPGRLNLIVAPNGYGKSVIRTAIGDLLFGIPERTPMDFRFGTERMRLLADVSAPTGDLSLVRRKGRGNTLALADGSPVAPEMLRQLLGSADLALFRELFGLDTALLRKGGQELINSQGRLGQVLFAAGGGMGRVRELLKALEEQRDKLGRAARHKSAPLWSAFTDWELASRDLRQAAIRPDGWARLESAASTTAAALQTLHDERRHLVDTQRDLQMIRAIRPWIERLRTAEHALQNSAQVPLLDADFARRWRMALEAQARTASAVKAAEDALSRARRTRAAMQFDPAWADANDTLTRLDEQRGDAAGALRDLPSVSDALTKAKADAATLRRDLGWDADVPLPAAPLVARARKHLQSHPQLRAAQASAAAQHLAALGAARDTADAQAALPAEADTTVIADLAALLRHAGTPTTRLDQARRRLREAEAALTSALAAIPDRLLSEAALANTAAPSHERLEAADRALSQAESALAQALRDREQRRQTQAQRRATLDSLEQRAMLPPPDALATARAARDALWQTLDASNPGQAVSFDRAIHAADAVADAMIAHGQEVAEALGLRRALEELQRALLDDDTAVAAAEQATEAAQANLVAIAQAAGGIARDMPALRAFLRGRAEAIECQAQRDREAGALADLHTLLTNQGITLATALGLPAVPLDALDVLVAEAERRVAAARAAIATRTELARQAAIHSAATETALAAITAAEDAAHTWQQNWADITAGLHRPASETPDATADALAQIEALRNAENARANAQPRVDAMTTAIATLAGTLEQLTPLAPDLAKLPRLDAAMAFHRRAQGERDTATRCSAADKQIVDAQNYLQQKQIEAAESVQTLQGLRAALYVETDEAAEAQLQRAIQVAAARKDRADALNEIARQGHGLALDALQARADATTDAADLAALEHLDARQPVLATEIDAASKAADEAKHALDRASQGTDAADAAQRRQQAQAALARTAEDALLLHATHALLQRALDRQAANADQPLLNRISATFRTITGGLHAGVAIEDGRNGQTMVALDANGQGRKPLEHLSEGTCDQLYLALRIAAVEDYAGKSPALPLVADDVLQTSDDQRTAAILDVLLDLSSHVQVIALTHHPHVAALAGRLPAGAVNLLHLAR